MILRRLGEGNEAYYTRVTFRLYVEEADNEANKDSALIKSGIMVFQSDDNLSAGQNVRPSASRV